MPQAKSPMRSLPMASGSAQSISELGVWEPGVCSLATASRARRAADSGAGVEGGQVLAVGDEPLEDAPGEVVGVGDAGGLHLLGGVSQDSQDLAGVAGVELSEDVPGDGEDGPVVDFEDSCPGGQGLGLRVRDLGAADEVEGLDPFVLSGDALVEHQGVGDDGTGHSAGLGNVGHSQEAGDLPSYDGIQVFEFVQDDRGRFDAVLQGVGGEVHFLLGNGDQSDKVSEVGNGAFEPARFGEAAAVLVEDTVGQAGVDDGLRYVVGVTDRHRVAQGYGRLDGAGLA